MTADEFISLAKTCRNRTELLQKMGGYENTQQNINKYIVPARKLANLTPDQLTELFLKGPSPTPTPSSPPEPTPVPSGTIIEPEPTPKPKLVVIGKTE